ncbi:membrane dipeptidase-domain-containing protein [Abortiporus biennis]|nr:membrane dipeptidase-domain-containing protein [Abortiporus biennis]
MPVNGQNEYAPLLGIHSSHRKHITPLARTAISAILFTAIVVTVIVNLTIYWDDLWDLIHGLPSDPDEAASRVLNSMPVIDGHIDLADLVRAKYSNNASAVNLRLFTPEHVDIPRLRRGRVGGFFWSAYVACPQPEAEGPDFLNPSWRVRDTLEQIDIVKLLVDDYPDVFRLATSSSEVEKAIRSGRIASLIGLEGGHQIGTSIAALRQLYALGVRYMTLTHFCHNAFADSGGYLEPLTPRWGGLSPLGRTLIQEMNRLGMLIDLSHTSDETARQTLNLTKAPVIFSHSSARSVHNIARNVPDDILKLIGEQPGKTDAVVMVNFAPVFVAPQGEANVSAVADHIDHIANVTGKQHVGLGSDFDGFGGTTQGLEDVSKYPNLIAELYHRGWNKTELVGLAGRNLLRVMAGAENTAKQLQSARVRPKYDIYDKRTDIPYDREF